MQARPTALWPIPVQLLAIIATELNQHSISTQVLLEGSGVTEEMLFDPEQLLPYRTTLKILQRACKISPIPHLGLAMGARQTPSGWGMLGYGINCCATVEDALHMAVQYHRVSSTFVEAEFRNDRGLLYWISKPPIDLGAALPCVIEEEFSSVCRSTPLLTGQKAQPVEAHFQYPEPKYVSLYHEVFDCPLFFSSGINQIVFSASVLQQPILQANPFRVAAAERLCIDFLEAHPAIDDLILNVRQLMFEQNAFLDEVSISERLNMTSRTLRNQLSRLGTSYRQILNDMKEQVARNDLLKSTLTVSDIATRSGFSEARSFRRAFKQWTGMTPNEVRNQNRLRQ
jgi:AraC-like DNA-binding protein